MKKLILIFILILSAFNLYAADKKVREIPRYRYVDVVNTITKYETKTIIVKTLDVAGVTIEIKGDTITLKSDTFALTIKKTIKSGVVTPVKIEP